MEYKLAGFFDTMMVLVVDLACMPNRFNVGGLLRLWKVEEVPLKEASECGLARDFSQYFGITDGVMVQQFYTTGHHCIQSIEDGDGNGRTERAANSLNLAPVCPALIRHGKRD